MTSGRRNVRKDFFGVKILRKGGFFTGVYGEIWGELSRVGVRIPMQDYKSLHV